jgi:hypothetical protein
VCCTAARREVEMMLCCSWRRGGHSTMRLVWEAGSRIADATECLREEEYINCMGGCTADTALSDRMGGDVVLAEDVQYE